jgi:hypothetical protein
MIFPFQAKANISLPSARLQWASGPTQHPFHFTELNIRRERGATWCPRTTLVFDIIYLSPSNSLLNQTIQILNKRKPNIGVFLQFYSKDDLRDLLYFKKDCIFLGFAAADNEKVFSVYKRIYISENIYIYIYYSAPPSKKSCYC